MNGLPGWWHGITVRERWMVAAAAVVLALTVVWLAVVEPLQRHRASLERGVPEQRALLAWMESVAGRLREDGGDAATDDQSLFAIVDRSVRTTPLAGTVQRLQPEGQGSVRIWLDDAPFDDIVRWLARLEREHGVSPGALSLERTDTPGLVNARVTLDDPLR